jgi:hypothetical protein
MSRDDRTIPADLKGIVVPLPFSPLPTIMASMPTKRLSADCAQCMPSGRTGNVIYAKSLSDYQAGIALDEQPFSLKVPVS